MKLDKIQKFYIILVVVCILTGWIVSMASFAPIVADSSVFKDINRIANSFEEYNEKRF